MNEETLNLAIRKFLKKVGITSQREVEKAIRAKLESGEITGTEIFHAQMTLEVPELGITLRIDGDIPLE